MMKVKYLMLAILVWFGQATLSAQDITTIILVRHAEKAFDAAGDPNLNAEGKIRAEELARVLQNTDIDMIYSTPFKRTRQTVQPLASSKKLEIVDYNPFKLDDIMDIIKQHAGKTLVFSGHSNTTPVILNKLIGEDQYRQLDEADYDNLYIVSYQGEGKAKIVSLEYGRDSDP